LTLSAARAEMNDEKNRFSAHSDALKKELASSQIRINEINLSAQEKEEKIIVPRLEELCREDMERAGLTSSK